MRYFEHDAESHDNVTAMRKLIAVASTLVIPLTILLFVQWPLRDFLQSYSRQANDTAQIIFSIYAAVSITSATRSGCHLAMSNHVTRNARSWRTWALILCLLPWALFLLWTSVPQALQSVVQLESFSEGLTPGYFVLRIALVLLVVMVLIEAVSTALSHLHKNNRSSNA
jgi:TRAP-type C4-dicarboxylate transport system permease small subunit